jgi:heme A synthase
MYRQQKPRDARVSLVETVKTPLGFFVLVVLIVEVILGGVAALCPGTDRTVLIVGMLGVVVLLVLIVACIAVFRPEALYGGRPSPANQLRLAKSDEGNHDETKSKLEDLADYGTPVVVSVTPTIGAVVDSGEAELRVTFSRPMRKGWSFVVTPRGECPKMVGEPVLSSDRRTIIARFALLPDRMYAFWLNSKVYQGFAGADGKVAIPYFVYFRTGHQDLGCSEHMDPTG